MASRRCFPASTFRGCRSWGAYAVQVGSLAAVEALLQRAGMAFRRLPAALVTAFPPELGTGSWVFVENPAELPWRA
jgi:hypothetical protein